MKRLSQFFGDLFNKKKEIPQKAVQETVVMPIKPTESFVESKGEIAPRGKSSVDTRWQLKKHRHNIVRAKNRASSQMRAYNKAHAV